MDMDIAGLMVSILMGTDQNLMPGEMLPCKLHSHPLSLLHAGTVSLDQTVDGDGESRTLLEQIDTCDDEISRRQDASDARKEIMEFAQQLSKYGLKLSDIVDNCPRQERTLAACHRVLAYVRENPMLLDHLTTTGKLPIAALSAGSNVERKTMERHRKYLVALLLAFTNGFEIIRGHLRQMSPRKGGAN